MTVRVSPPVSGSLPSLRLPELAAYTQFVALEVKAGRYPQIEYNDQDRWHERLYRDDRVDLWLISWMPTQGTQLHDHGGSSGAFTVVQGCLQETAYRSRLSKSSAVTHTRGNSPLLDLARHTDATVSFGKRYVHDVRNVLDEPAVSVHAYSPPLTRMNYYDVDETGALAIIASVDTDDPEAEFEVTELAG